MKALSKYRVLMAGIVSPFAALILYTVVYDTLTARSADLQKDWLFRLSVSTASMFLPFLLAFALAVGDRGRGGLKISGKIGLAISVLSLGLAWQPIHSGVLRSRQVRNLAMRDVPAPAFHTPDILGNMQALDQQKGKVVLVNIWATWCGPCRAEMPKLDRLFAARKDQGFIVFGMSDESADVQLQYLKEVPVRYPLLTLTGNVPGMYRDIARYPAIFLIDRQGRLQPAPGPDQPFEDVAAAVDKLLQPGT